MLERQQLVRLPALLDDRVFLVKECAINTGPGFHHDQMHLVS